VASKSLSGCSGEEGEPTQRLPGSHLGGRHKISQQIMKLSLIAGWLEGVGPEVSGTGGLNGA